MSGAVLVVLPICGRFWRCSAQRCYLPGGVALIEEVVAVFQLKDARDAGKVNPGGDKLADAL